MTLRDIAIKNIKGNMNKYVMYYLSNTLVVTVFFIFANFIYNSEVSGVGSLGSMGAMVAKTIYLCEFVILIFTMVFTSYSITNFLKSREKEFGLLSMFGLTKSQIRQYIMFENLIVSLVSIATGLLFGILFSKLFFMAIAAILTLNAEVPFSIAGKALVITVGSFGVLFQGISFIASFKIKNNNIVELLKGNRIAKPIPKFSRVKAAFAVMFMAAGYVMAVFSGMAIIITMFPILIFEVIGTYMLYSQFSVFLTNKLKKNKDIFYKGTNMVSLSQIIYKLKDNAKILFIVSILGAVTLTASVSVYSIQKNIQAELEMNMPQDISFIETGIGEHKILNSSQMETMLKASGHPIEYKKEITLIKAKNANLGNTKGKTNNSLTNREDFYIMSNSDYNSIAKHFKKPQLQLNEGEVVVNSYNFMGAKGIKLFSDSKLLELKVESKTISLNLKNEISGGIINADKKNTNTAVVSDSEFKKLATDVPNDKKLVYYGYNIKAWAKSEEIVSKIKSMVSKENLGTFQERVINISGFLKAMSLFLFIGTFIAIIFFIATGSILYFKMFNEMQKDRHEFIALKKMGMSQEEVGKIISIQAFIMFFLPFAIAILHTSFAIKALSNLLSSNLLIYMLSIVGIYFVLQLIYFLFAKNMYVKQIEKI